jgi:hypothetical protein
MFKATARVKAICSRSMISTQTTQPSTELWLILRAAAPGPPLFVSTLGGGDHFIAS